MNVEFQTQDSVRTQPERQSMSLTQEKEIGQLRVENKMLKEQL